MLTKKQMNNYSDVLLWGLKTARKGNFRKDEIVLVRLDLAAINMADEHEIVRGQFLYHGASTGRFTGKGIQFQNLPRGNFESDYALEDMVECIEFIKKLVKSSHLSRFEGLVGYQGSL